MISEHLNTVRQTDQLVHIVDVDVYARESVEALAQAMNLSTRVCNSVEDFLAQYRGEPGCLIADLVMHGHKAIELLDRLRNQNRFLPTIITSAHAEVAATVKVMQRGALTVLEKPYSMDALWDAIQAALSLDAAVRERLEECRKIRECLDKLTDSEHVILKLIIEGLPNKAIAGRLDVGVRTVESRRRNIFRKMQADSLARLVRDVTIVQETDAPFHLQGQLMHT